MLNLEDLFDIPKHSMPYDVLKKVIIPKTFRPMFDPYYETRKLSDIWRAAGIRSVEEDATRSRIGSEITRFGLCQQNMVLEIMRYFMEDGIQYFDTVIPEWKKCKSVLGNQLSDISCEYRGLVCKNFIQASHNSKPSSGYAQMVKKMNESDRGYGVIGVLSCSDPGCDRDHSKPTKNLFTRCGERYFYFISGGDNTLYCAILAAVAEYFEEHADDVEKMKVGPCKKRAPVRKKPLKAKAISNALWRIGR